MWNPFRWKVPVRGKPKRLIPKQKIPKLPKPKGRFKLWYSSLRVRSRDLWNKEVRETKILYRARWEKLKTNLVKGESKAVVGLIATVFGLGLLLVKLIGLKTPHVATTSWKWISSLSSSLPWMWIIVGALVIMVIATILYSLYKHPQGRKVEWGSLTKLVGQTSNLLAAVLIVGGLYWFVQKIHSAQEENDRKIAVAIRDSITACKQHLYWPGCTPKIVNIRKVIYAGGEATQIIPPDYTLDVWSDDCNKIFTGVRHSGEAMMQKVWKGHSGIDSAVITGLLYYHPARMEVTGETCGDPMPKTK